jgi:hypothetical protein
VNVIVHLSPERHKRAALPAHRHLLQAGNAEIAALMEQIGDGRVDETIHRFSTRSEKSRATAWLSTGD